MGPVPELEDLIGAVNERAPSGNALDLLEAAAETSQDLNSLTDQLLGHFVDDARSTGASWSQIGERLRVTKQAAQQRFASKPVRWLERFETAVPKGVLDRFTHRAQTALGGAVSEARAWSHNYVGTEHILMGLLSEPKGLASRALDDLGIKPALVRERIAELIGLGDISKAAASRMSLSAPFTPRAKKVLELSFKEALQLGHNYIGTEHILLGLIAEGNGIAAQVLISLGADHGKVRAKILELLTEA